MKTILTFIIICGISTLVLAQKTNSSISKSIKDNGKTLSIRVRGNINGKEVNYQRTFDVESLNRTEKEELQEKIMDSLDVEMNVPLPVEPVTPAEPVEPVAATPSASISMHHSDKKAPVISSRTKNEEAYAVGGANAFTKEVKFNPENGRLFMRYRYTRNGVEYITEKTVNAGEKSEAERQAVVNEFEKEIGISALKK